jgi:diguanylate cyclase
MALGPAAPSQVARETILQLAARRLPPTPQNYGRLYREICGGDAGPAWPRLVRDIVREWERSQVGITQARKREQLEQALAVEDGDDERLRERLAELIAAWRERAAAVDAGVGLPADLVAKTLDYAVVQRLGHSPAVQEEAKHLAQRAREATSVGALLELGAPMKQFFFRLQLAGDDFEALQSGLLGLLRLLTDNVAELLGDDRWMKGQVALVQRLIGQPLDREMLASAQKALKELAFKQAMRKAGLDEAKTALKSMVALFVDRLAAVGASTREFHERLGSYARRIAETDDIAALGSLVGELLRDARAAEADMLRVSAELEDARRHSSDHEERIRVLERELEHACSQARVDKLTGALNRRGLEQAWAAETSRAKRLGSPLCLAMLDIDNFKALNDRVGHQAGDRALVHLAGVVGRSLRPSDTIARFGGEEFVLLLPHTPLEEAMAVMTRLQRELTRRFFLHNNERLLVTFSAGLTAWRSGEPQEAALERADSALYEAKRAGKNRVCAG